MKEISHDAVVLLDKRRPSLLAHFDSRETVADLVVFHSNIPTSLLYHDSLVVVETGHSVSANENAVSGLEVEGILGQTERCVSLDEIVVDELDVYLGLLAVPEHGRSKLAHPACGGYLERCYGESKSNRRVTSRSVTG